MCAGVSKFVFALGLGRTILGESRHLLESTVIGCEILLRLLHRYLSLE